jgi:hypothetical protein
MTEKVPKVEVIHPQLKEKLELMEIEVNQSQNTTFPVKAILSHKSTQVEL